MKYTRAKGERERERKRGSTRVLAKNLRGSAGFTGLEKKHARRGRIPINFDSTILYPTLLLRAPFRVKRDLAFEYCVFPTATTFLTIYIYIAIGVSGEAKEAKRVLIISSNSGS